MWPGLLRRQIGSHTSSSEDLKTILMELQCIVACSMYVTMITNEQNKTKIPFLVLSRGEIKYQ